MRTILPNLALCLCCLLALSDCQRRRIESLPRLNFRPNFRQYSGYLNSTDNRRLFYWLVESSHAPASVAPLVLWMNGGPGCSSVGGLLMTNGPFLANDRAELDRNEFAWNRLANVLYIDSPSGVGLSEPGPIDQSVLNDNATTQLNLAALLHFYSLFPEYRGRPFYITGESYAGIYIPLLASAIVGSGRHPQLINLTGIAVGNGLHVPYNDTDFASFRSALTDSMGASIGQFSVMKANRTNRNYSLNNYNIAHACYHKGEQDGYPCLNTSALGSYINDPEVLSALGVSSSISNKYVVCLDSINGAYRRAERDVLDEFVSLANKSVSVMLYHGTLDYLLPVGITLKLLKRLPLKDGDGQAAWFYCLDRPGFGLQIGGVETSYKRGWIRHRTVIGAGHTVPTDRPEIGLRILEDLLAWPTAGQPNCSSPPRSGSGDGSVTAVWPFAVAAGVASTLLLVSQSRPVL